MARPTERDCGRNGKEVVLITYLIERIHDKHNTNDDKHETQQK